MTKGWKRGVHPSGLVGEVGPRWQRGRIRPLVIGHRGASATHPENTIAAVSAAFDAGADGVEVDVRQCASGEIVVFHDDDCQRLCGHPGRIQDLSWAELSRLHVNGERIPLLADVLEEVGARLVNVEIKNVGLRRRSSLVDATARVIENRKVSENVLVSSFDPVTLARVGRAAPRRERALLFHSGQWMPLRRGWCAPWVATGVVHVEHTLASEQMLRSWCSRGYRVAVWTVDSPDRIQAMSAAGANAVICNDPESALRALPT